jgi:hypothetical protein
VNRIEIRTTGSTSPRRAKLAAARAVFNVVTIAGNAGIGYLCDLCQGLTIVNSLSIDGESDDAFYQANDQHSFIHSASIGHTMM